MKKFVSVLCLSLAGCATAYVAPSKDASTASISFEVKANAILGYGAFLFKRYDADDHACFQKTQKMAQVFVGNPILHTDNPADIPVESGNLGFRVAVAPAGVFMQTPCSYDVNFTASQDQKYKVFIEWGSGGCAVNVTDEVSGKPIEADVKPNRC